MTTPQPGPCERYRTRLDAHLATLPNDAARRAFCDREHAKWVDRYESFQRAVDRGEDVAGATAWDFQITLCDVEHRRAKYGPAMQAVA
jgi:hypothetical protein